MPHAPIVVVGAGPAGLAAAAMLRGAGADVVVLERGERLGTRWRGQVSRALRLREGGPGRRRRQLRVGHRARPGPRRRRAGLALDPVGAGPRAAPGPRAARAGRRHPAGTDPGSERPTRSPGSSGGCSSATSRPRAWRRRATASSPATPAAARSPLVGQLGVLGPDGIPLYQGGRADPALPGLHFTGFRNPITGALRELRFEARAIAAALSAVV
jgi:putative NAD(P)-binding protein